MSKKPTEHKLGSTVILELPESRGGKTKVKVVSSSSCIGCAMSGLGHSHCPEQVCQREARSDGQSIHYEKVEE